jgi:uncharacterized protein (TIGR02466 family)
MTTPKVIHQDIFPTRIWSSDLSFLSPNFPRWQNDIASLREKETEHKGRSNRLGWNSDLKLFELEAFRPLADAAVAVFASAIRECAPQENIKFTLSAWANVHGLGGYNVLHSHPGCLMSGAFYLSLPEGSGPLIFQDPRPGVLHNSHEFSGPYPNAQLPFVVEPRQGQLVVFPSWLGHFVEPHLNRQNRICIAINALRA